MIRSIIFITILVAMFLVPAARADVTTGATSLGDLSTFSQLRGSYPQQLTSVGDLIFFSALHVTSGHELWVSDGTSDGTFLVKDVNPGLGGSYPASLTELDGQLLFTAKGPESGLWVSDGTVEGTRLITDGIRNPKLEASKLTVFDGFVYLHGYSQDSGSELWRYSLRKDELVQVADLVPGPGSSDPDLFKIVAGRLIFNTTVGMHVIDPQLEGAEPFLVPGVKELSFSSEDPVVEYNGDFYFQASTPAVGKELWRTDGTAEGTKLFLNLGSSPEDSSPDSLVVYNGFLYFTANGYGVGRNLFFTDGSPADIQILYPQALAKAGNRKSKQFTSASPLVGQESEDARFTSPIAKYENLVNAQPPIPWPRQIPEVSVIDGVMFFLGIDSSNSTSLWRSDGTVDGSEAIRMPSNIESPVTFSLPFAVNDSLLLYGSTNETGYELWRVVDGKSVVPMGELYPGGRSGVGSSVVANDRLYFAGSTPDTDMELWESQGTRDSTRLVANIMRDDSADSRNHRVIDTSSGLLFLGPADALYGVGVWRTDGTPAGTSRLRSFEAQTDSGGYVVTLAAGSLLRLNSRAIFNLSTLDHETYESQEEAWAVEGDDVFRIGDQGLRRPVRLNGLALASIDGDLWRTDGHKGSVTRIASINDGPYSPRLEFTTASENYVWFFSGNLTLGSTVWRSDGTAEGTTIAADVTIDAGIPRYFPLGAFKDNFYFLSGDFNNGVKLWRTGNAGATLLGTLEPQWFGSSSDFLGAHAARLGDKLLLNMQLTTDGSNVLYVTDGTPNGTLRLTVFSTAGTTVASNIVVFDDLAYFTVYDETRSAALWHSDGTQAGTGPVQGLNSDATLNSWPHFTIHNEALYLVAKTDDSGEEIWKTDGKRMVQITELLPGSLSAAPSSLHSVGGRLYFTAWVPGQGRELMVLDE